jgi:Cytochrome P460
MKIPRHIRKLDQYCWIRTTRRLLSSGNRKRYILLIFALVILAASYQVKSQNKTGDQLKSQNNTSFNGFDLVDKNGIISKPADYRDKFQVLGAFSVASQSGDTDLHYTYAPPGTADYYRKNGKFADGTVLVKEVFGTEHGQMTTGDVHWAKGTKVWFIMVKDEKGRYPGNPLWGDGWGWALYKSDAPDKQVAVNYKKDCLGCHVPAQSTDWVYVQGYPVLKSK